MKATIGSNLRIKNKANKANRLISTEVLHVLASLGCAVYPESQFGVVSQCQCAGRVRLVAP